MMESTPPSTLSPVPAHLTQQSRVIETKALVTKSDTGQQYEARRVYRSALHSTASMDPVEWHRRWNLARIEAELYRVPELVGDLPKRDFLEAAAVFDSVWSSQLETQLDQYDLHRIGVDFTLEDLGTLFSRRAERLVKNRPQGSKRLAGGLIAATQGKSAFAECICGSSHRWPPQACDVALFSLHPNYPLERLLSKPNRDMMQLVKERATDAKYANQVAKIHEEAKKAIWAATATKLYV